jgi:hypothetical protein
MISDVKIKNGYLSKDALPLKRGQRDNEYW